MRIRNVTWLCLVLIVAALSTPAWAALTYRTSNSSGDWTTVTWGNGTGLPGIGDDAYVCYNKIVDVNSSLGDIGGLRIYSNIGAAGSGTLNINTDGSLNIPAANGGYLVLGYSSGAGGNAILNINGGSLTTSRVDMAASAGAGVSTINVHSGNLNVGGSGFFVNYNGASTVNQDGGLVTVAGSTFLKYGNNTYAGHYNLSGGTFKTYTLYFYRKNSDASSVFDLTGTGVLKTNNITFRSEYGDAVAAYNQNGGTVAPISGAGAEVGQLTFANLTAGGTTGYTMGSDATLAIDIASASSFDNLSMGGTFTAEGTLAINLMGGFTPILGSTFKIATAGSYFGNFDTITSSAMPESTGWSYDGATGTLTVVEVPEPATMGLLLVGGVAALIRKRK